MTQLPWLCFVGMNMNVILLYFWGSFSMGSTQVVYYELSYKHVYFINVF